MADITSADARTRYQFKAQRGLDLRPERRQSPFADAMNSMSKTGIRRNMSSDGASAIEMVGVTNGKRFSSAPKDSVLFSSVSHGWHGIIVEEHCLPPDEMSDHYLIGHRLVVGMNRDPVWYGWKNGDKHRDSVLNPGDFCLQTHGSVNAPRWRETFEFVNFALEPRFVAGVVGEAMPSDKIEFETVRCGSDATIAHYAAAFRAELAEPGEVAPVVLFLCSKQAEFMVGASVKVDGGYTVQ